MVKETLTEYESAESVLNSWELTAMMCEREDAPTRVALKESLRLLVAHYDGRE